MKKIMIVLALGTLFMFSSCKKDTSVAEAKCLETYLNYTNRASDMLVNKIISSEEYTKLCTQAKKDYDSCIKTAKADNNNNFINI